MKHLNGNLIAVIDTETTGTDPNKHDIIEVCVLVLDRFLKPAKEFMPFAMTMKPTRLHNIDPEALRIQNKRLDAVVKEKLCKDRDKMVKIAVNGFEPDVVADLFDIWWKKLKLAPFKRIMPLACNWVFDQEFIKRWLGPEAFNYYFDPRYRDVMSMTLYDNDVADWRGHPFQYPTNHLQYICTTLGIERTRAHTALDDCVATAEAYRRLIQRTELRNLPKAIEVADEVER